MHITKRIIIGCLLFVSLQVDAQWCVGQPFQLGNSFKSSLLTRASPRQTGFIHHNFLYMSQPCLRNVVVTNQITNQMATYTKHWSGYHLPEWKLVVNGVVLDSTVSQEISVINNMLSLEFWYEFFALGRSYTKGSACATFCLPKDITHVDVEFSWDREERLLLTTKTCPGITQPTLVAHHEQR
jgi:hypothetical protein